ncbi:hydroxypyruvate isomerase family protein [Flavilitoribacter nigricans]|uniref:Xylose isomerase n=1 Tax=Flavilitoribacter nigricans (strain ATCC 23147 / DSM 23189 / NBRC 102662 / NCIMB 1420 / SS-2) TaxID=1122177 RepID=A0A2D0NBD3_FLAN2|nr:TIM barrel protein [Flavilitoribacter nigricans]PHN05814.1 xylose isomerase [Flavilitoribacter nigricans DSM 23189 = NBRC 102662]
MKRRTFLQNGVTTTAALATGAVGLNAKSTTGLTAKAKPFKMKFAPHLGMFKHHAGDDPIDQLVFMAEQGFSAFEDNGMKGRDVELQKKMGETMAKHGIDMGVFVAHDIYWSKPNLASGKEDLREEFLTQIKESVEVAKRCNAKWMTVVPGYQDLRQNMHYQTLHVAESLKRACEILEPHGLVMVLEPLNFYNHPGLFLSESPQAFELCKLVGSPSCKILFDIYHQQIQEGNLLPNIEKTWDEIGYFQIGDNPGRKEPTTGEINYKNIFKYINEQEFPGILGMEHGNSQSGKEGEAAVLQAYREVDVV